MDSNSAIIGAWGDDDNGNNSGSAYIFEHNGLSWSQQQKLTASDGSPENKFGYAVSINDGNTLIGAPLDNDNGISSGAAYIFNFDGSTWTQEQKLFASDGADFDNFASAVSIDGNLAIIGAYRDNAPGSDSGSAYIFSCNGATWSEQQKLTASDGASYDKFGYSVAIKDNLAIVGAYNDKVDANATGSAYIFKFDGTRWNEIQKLTASDARADDLFGQAVSIQKGYAIIGAPGNDGTAVNSGAAYIFKNDGLNWTQIQKITAPDPNTNSSFGGSVSIGTTTIIIGAPSDDDSGTNSGSAYLFKFDGKNWQYQQKLYAPVPAGYTEFGRSVAINSHTALIGAHMDNENGGNSGSAQVFELCPIADLGADCSVTFKDFASLAADWIGFFGN
jgi:predicted amidohydrolase